MSDRTSTDEENAAILQAIHQYTKAYTDAHNRVALERKTAGIPMGIPDRCATYVACHILLKAFPIAEFLTLEGIASLEEYVSTVDTSTGPIDDFEIPAREFKA